MRHPILWLLGLSLACPVVAQDVLDIEQQLDFDAPEAWAMKYFTSTSLLTSLGAVEALEPGAVELGLEAIQIPRHVVIHHGLARRAVNLRAGRVGGDEVLGAACGHSEARRLAPALRPVHATVQARHLARETHGLEAANEEVKCIAVLGENDDFAGLARWPANQLEQLLELRIDGQR